MILQGGKVVTSSVTSTIKGVTSDKPSAARTRACDAIQVMSVYLTVTVLCVIWP